MDASRKRRGARARAAGAIAGVFTLGLGAAALVYFVQIRGPGFATEFAGVRGPELLVFACATVLLAIAAYVAVAAAAGQGAADSPLHELLQRAQDIDTTDPEALHAFDASPALRELVGRLVTERAHARELSDRMETLRGEIDGVAEGMRRSAQSLEFLQEDNLGWPVRHVVHLWNALVNRVQQADLATGVEMPRAAVPADIGSSELGTLVSRLDELESELSRLRGAVAHAEAPRAPLQPADPWSAGEQDLEIGATAKPWTEPTAAAPAASELERAALDDTAAPRWGELRGAALDEAAAPLWSDPAPEAPVRATSAPWGELESAAESAGPGEPAAAPWGELESAAPHEPAAAPWGELESAAPHERAAAPWGELESAGPGEPAAAPWGELESAGPGERAAAPWGELQPAAPAEPTVWEIPETHGLPGEPETISARDLLLDGDSDGPPAGYAQVVPEPQSGRPETRRAIDPFAPRSLLPDEFESPAAAPAPRVPAPPVPEFEGMRFPEFTGGKHYSPEGKVDLTYETHSDEVAELPASSLLFDPGEEAPSEDGVFDLRSFGAAEYDK